MEGCDDETNKETVMTVKTQYSDSTKLTVTNLPVMTVNWYKGN